jgi:hypothetical protein
MDADNKTFMILVKELPPQLRTILERKRPELIGFEVQETCSDPDIDQIGDQSKHEGFLITCYLHRQTSEMFFRVVDTEDNWRFNWYRATQALRLQTTS